MTISRSVAMLILLTTGAYPQAQSNAGEVMGSVLDQSGGALSTRYSLYCFTRISSLRLLIHQSCCFDTDK